MHTHTRIYRESLVKLQIHALLNRRYTICPERVYTRIKDITIATTLLKLRHSFAVDIIFAAAQTRNLDIVRTRPSVRPPVRRLYHPSGVQTFDFERVKRINFRPTFS